MNWKLFAKVAVVSVIQLLAYGAALHGVGLNDHGYAIIPLSVAAISGVYVYRKEK